jgi:hypothetical protein
MSPGGGLSVRILQRQFNAENAVPSFDFTFQQSQLSLSQIMDSESTDGGLHDEVKTVIIRIFISHDAAELSATNLEAHGIQCWINSDDAGGMLPNLTVPGGVRLLVRASDAEAAIALLDVQVSPAEVNQIETEAIVAAPPETVPPKHLAPGQILFSLVIGMILGVTLCLLFQQANNLGTKKYYHFAAGGKRDEAWVYRDGHLVELMKDRNLDGDWDQWTFYEHGRAVRSEYDNNFDGKADGFWTFSDDGMDTLQRDTDFNGIPDEFCTYKHQIIQQLDIKPNGSKFSTVREIFQNGVFKELWRGGDSNGNFKEVVRYDPFLNPISTNTPAEFQLLSPSSK